MIAKLPHLSLSLTWITIVTSQYQLPSYISPANCRPLHVSFWISETQLIFVVIRETRFLEYLDSMNNLISRVAGIQYCQCWFHTVHFSWYNMQFNEPSILHGVRDLPCECSVPYLAFCADMWIDQIKLRGNEIWPVQNGKLTLLSSVDQFLREFRTFSVKAFYWYRQFNPTNYTLVFHLLYLPLDQMMIILETH